MQFLKTAFWVVLAVAVALFCKANNDTMTVKLWSDFIWETKKWFPMLLAFALGAGPLWLAGRATRWRYRKRLESAERALANAALVPAPSSAAASAAIEAPTDSRLTPGEP